MADTDQIHDESKETIVDPDLMLFEFYEEGSTVFDRAVANNEDIIYDGNTYTQANFNIVPPDSENRQVTTSLSVSNISRAAGKAINAARGRIRCRVIFLDGKAYTVGSGGVRTYTKVKWDNYASTVVADPVTNIYTVSGDLAPKADSLFAYPLIKTSRTFHPGLYL